METIRGSKVSMIFQEPMTSLNPVFRAGDQIDEVVKLHNPEMTDEQVKELSLKMIDPVGIAITWVSTNVSSRAFGRHAATRHDCHGTCL